MINIRMTMTLSADTSCIILDTFCQSHIQDEGGGVLMLRLSVFDRQTIRAAWSTF